MNNAELQNKKNSIKQSLCLEPNVNNTECQTEIATHKLKKFRPLDKGKVLKELTVYLIKVDKATYYLLHTK